MNANTLCLVAAVIAFGVGVFDRRVNWSNAGFALVTLSLLV